jgi:hypothetical protein
MSKSANVSPLRSTQRANVTHLESPDKNHQFYANEGIVVQTPPA